MRHARRLAGRAQAAQELPLLRAGLELGLFEALGEPRHADALAARRGLAPDLVEAWLRAAHAHGLVERTPDGWRRGSFASWLVEDRQAAAWQALLAQVGSGQLPVLAALPALLKGAPRPAFAGDPVQARRVAAASRLTERRALAALRRVPGAARARHVLDVGCGSGSALAALLRRRRDARGVGVEVDPEVAEEARRRLREAEVSRRAEILTGDVLQLELPERGFDLILLRHVLPWFGAEERGLLLRRLRHHLATGGALVIETLVAEGSEPARRLGLVAPAADFDLFLRAHRDLHGLPTPQTLRDALAEAGLDATGEVPVLPGGSVRLVWGRRAAAPT